MDERSQEEPQAAKTGDDVYVVTRQVGHLLRRAYQRHLAIFQNLAEDLNLTSMQFVTLCALSDRGPCSQRDLVEATAIDQATIRGIVDRLQARGLLQVLRDESDGRKVVMSLTSEGKDLLAAMLPRGPAISEQTMAPLNPAERVALLYLLRKLSD
ncbi:MULTISPECIES: MarR family winged helix-turn-helix transcriptional regulator [unclassified Rhizobium]|uniref:MarR family winged helix-turn-helix transcriptional regulator n=1 Tax=unclassified Rhizobium TaxID=2613769 RepID=UPI0016017DBF|nr:MULTISPECIES: MarR family transcriptional regulator [unclassified Rhizobium]MBB1248807.1 MarR family transcriptional regulator [Rhizobium sp. G21]MCV3766191.1 MarR family transcriptional regulator [Rhizobium sp. TRM95796]